MILWLYFLARTGPTLTRVAARIIKWTVTAVLAVMAAPVTTVVLIGVAGAWLRGWPPERLRRAALWSLPMTAASLLTELLTTRSPQAAITAPVTNWVMSWHVFDSGALVPAFIWSAPVAVPAGLAIASWAWGTRIYRIETGLSGKTVASPVIFDERQWHRQARYAKKRASVPGTVPLLDRDGRIVAGTTIRAIGHPWHPVLAVPATALGRHQVIIGSSGSGETTLMMRTWAAWYAATLNTYQARDGARPLLVVLDCKGGPDSRAKAARTRTLLHAAGAGRVAIWPDDASVSLWSLPPRELAVVLFQLLDTADTGPAAYYADITQAALVLAVTAPPGPPSSGTEFLDRLDAGWLTRAYATDPAHLAAVQAAAKHLPDVALRYRTLLDRLGPALTDNDVTLANADAWYFILEGTREQSVAQAQALAITELLACTATSLDTEPRSILLACDDYSAISGKVPLWQLYERGRSLGIGVQVSAQSWQGLGGTDDDRYRIAATADGGLWLLRTPHPEPIIGLAGTRRVIETATKIVEREPGDEGSSRVQHAWVADPGIARRLATGQAGYIHAGGCTWIHVPRPRPSPLTPAAPARPAPVIIPPQPAGTTGTSSREYSQSRPVPDDLFTRSSYQEAA